MTSHQRVFCPFVDENPSNTNERLVEFLSSLFTLKEKQLVVIQS
jgi:hypothetical protein